LEQTESVILEKIVDLIVVNGDLYLQPRFAEKSGFCSSGHQGSQ
jgi:hypothetical protein